MLEKIFTTFYASNVLLYRERRFKKYSELIYYLLVAEQNNEFFFMRNHQSHLIGFEPFPKVNVISSQTYGLGRGHGRSHGRGRNF